MDVSFDEIPDDLWDDWVWLVTPAGLMRAVEEEGQSILSSPYRVTSTYTVNLPKMVMFDLMWSSRLDMNADDLVDVKDLCRPVSRDPRNVLNSLAFLLSNYPLILRWKVPQEKLCDLAPNNWDDVYEPPELLWYVPPELEGVQLDIENIAIDFFNPFVPSLRKLGVHRSVIGVISPVRNLNQVFAALNGKDGTLLEAVNTAMLELEQRGLVEMEGGRVKKMTARGARMAQTEPLTDCVNCRCRVDEMMEYELGGDED